MESRPCKMSIPSISIVLSLPDDVAYFLSTGISILEHLVCDQNMAIGEIDAEELEGGR